ncbi:MaoC/PaaZ C-terminal domain-containing protein [Haladaptatus caseinilyticus]|uniref:MaoC/PaaZ C-terminal domain-containing protein n=1 Tax=Haladaptatus caseinilyticus TaxID=2993314 RepID=UPI00224A829D|nr:MaoC/PaaZ C-terminal domain-containing protein [Haladaptatus caseinilyticus]
MTDDSTPRYYEDLVVGETFDLGAETVTADEIASFGEQFDPQPIHTDSAAAADSMFGELVASGWHTAAISMRRFVDGIIEQAGLAVVAGVEVEMLQWRRPVRPGDVLSADAEIVGLEEWDEDHGVVVFELRMHTDEGDVVLLLTKRVLVERE